MMTTKEGELVLDPMCGSGTTGVVCSSLGRKAILCDICEEYIKISEKRLGVTRWGAKNRTTRNIPGKITQTTLD